MTTSLAQVAGLFTAPMLAAIGAAAVSIPIIIHLMSRFRRKPEPWGAMRFLIEAYRKQRKRLQIEKLLLLLVRCMVVALAGLALAGPVLSGCSEDGLALGGRGGRVVYIVIDDALSSQTREAGTTRLALLKDRADEVVDQMQPIDRAVVVRMARPVGEVLDAPTSDRGALKQAIDRVEPRYSGGSLIEALSVVQRSIDEEGLRDGDAVVVLLSDFPASAGYFDQPLPPELEGLGQRAKLVTALPAQGTDNLQVMSLEPRRRMIVAESTGATVIGGRVVLRRFGGIAQQRSAELEVTIESAQGQVLESTRRAVTWPAGEREQGANFDLPVVLAAESIAGGGRELVIRARLVAEADAAGLDVLAADDAAAAVVRLRSRLQVALIDDESDVNPNPGELEPGQWVRAALSPAGPGSVGSFELSTVLPMSVKKSTLDPFDAVIVLRPDELTPRGWSALQRFTAAGGMAWVFTPAVETEPDWARAMVEVFDLDWGIGESLVRYEPAETGGKRAAAVDQSTAPPEQLQFLAADWREKLGWVSVVSWLPLSTQPEDRWIVLDTSDKALPEPGMPVMLARTQAGRGTLLFCSTALDTRYTNLPIRAVFVPLMHDALRGVLGSTSGEAALTSGDRPELDKTWAGVGELRLLGEGVDASEGETRLRVQSTGDQVVLLDAAQLPGVYRGVVGGSPRLLAVNVDSDAGDTFGGKGRLEELLDKLGGWQYLQDQEEQGGVLAKVDRGADLTGLLLWALLGLVLLETLLARWFSHATDRDRPTLFARALGALHGSDTAGKASAGGGA